MADKILYTNKEELIDDESIPLKNKVTADDMNEIKEVVNSHADDIETLETEKADRTEIPTDLSELSNENTKFVNETQLANAVNDEKVQRQNADNAINNTIATISVDYGRTIELSIDSSTFILTATLKNKNGTTLSSSNIDLPIESVVVNGRYDSASKTIILTLQNGNTIEIPVGDLISGLQSEITPQNKLSSDLVDDTNHTNKFVTQAEKNQIETNKNNITSLDENKENISNKVTELTSESTDIQYPSAKAVYDNESALKEKLDRYKNTIETELGDSTDTETDLTLNGTAEYDVDLELSGNTYQETTEGYQLFDKNNATVKSLNASATAGNTGTFAIASNQKHVYIQCKPNTTYKVQKDISDVAVLGIYETEQEPAVSVAYKTLYFLSNSPETVTVTTGENVNYLDVRLNTNAITSEVLQKILDSILIYEGSDIKPYEKYTGENPAPNPEYPQDIQVVKGNNEVKIETGNRLNYTGSHTNSGVTTIVEDGSNFTSNGTVTTNNYFNLVADKQYELDSLTQYFYVEGLESSNRLKIYSTTDARNYDLANGLNEINFRNLTNVFRIYFSETAGTVIKNRNVKITMFYTSYTQNKFVPHKEQTYPITLPEGMEMCKIGDYADKFVWQNNKWYKSKKIKKNSLINVNFNVEQKRNNTILFFGQLYEKARGSFICNYFRHVGYGSISQDIEFIGDGSGYNSRAYLSINKTRLNGYSDDLTNAQIKQLLTNYLQTIDGELYYPLATPVPEEITDTTLITQLNNIKQAYTYQGQTNISQTNEDLPFIITADFKLSNLSRIEALESALETVSSRVDLLEE